MNIKLAMGAGLLGAFALGLVVAVTGADSADEKTVAKSADQFSDAEEDAIRALVRDYLINNPEVILESVSAYQERAERAEEERLVVGASDNLQALVSGPGAHAVGKGADGAKVAVIEFFDYNCSACKSATGNVQKLVSSDKDVKVVLRELPIFGETSELIAEYALAAAEQGKYRELHFALMSAKGRIDEDRALEIAKKQGLDIDALKAARQDPKVKAAIVETRALARAMGIGGTPCFVVASLNGEFIDVMPGFAPGRLKEAIKAAKKAA